MEEIKLYRLSYEEGEYCVGTEEEVISEHNQWVRNSGRFVEKSEDSCEFDESDLIQNNLATTIDDLKEHWEVDQFYTVNLYSIIENSPKYKERIYTIQQLWECIRRGYDYNESQIHMRAFSEGKTTVKKLVVEDNNA
jgi:SPX domain protein involved in polyphosphate accumulation